MKYFTALVGIVLLAGCGEAAPDSLAQMNPIWGDNERWTIDPTPALRIGTVYGDSGEIFVRITQVSILPGQRIAVADDGTASVRVFDARGGLLTSFGRRGLGPGEFTRLSTVASYRGDSLLTIDLPRGAVAIWSGEGELGRTLQLPDGHRPRLPVVLSEGRLLTVTVPMRGAVTGVQSEPGQLVDSVRPLVVDALGIPEGFLPTLPLQQLEVTRRREIWPAFLLPQASLAADGDQVYWGWPDRFEVLVFSTAGDLVGVFKRPYRRVAVTAFKRDSLADEMVRTSYSGSLSIEAARDAVLANAMRGDSLPAFANPGFYGLHVDSDGNLWIPPFQVGQTPPSVWTVFSGSGAWLGEVAGLRDLQIFDIGTESVVGVVRDELGVEYVQVHRLLRSSGS